MLYTFADVETGEKQLLEYSMLKVPDIGAVVQRKGRKLRRQVEGSQGVATQKPVIAGDFYTDYQSAPNTIETAGAKHYDEHGRPKFTSRQEARDYASRKSDNGYASVFDG